MPSDLSRRTTLLNGKRRNVMLRFTDGSYTKKTSVAIPKRKRKWIIKLKQSEQGVDAERFEQKNHVA